MIRSCGSCDYSVAIEGSPDGLLECRRRAIRAVGIDEGGDVVSAFPVCEPDMWCGEYYREIRLNNISNYAQEW